MGMDSLNGSTMTQDLDSRADDQRLTDADARRVLERAIALDASRAGETTIAELRRVAQELNVSPFAFGEALRELQNKVVVAPPASVTPEPEVSQAPPAKPKRNWWRRLAITFGSLFMGG